MALFHHGVSVRFKVLFRSAEPVRMLGGRLEPATPDRYLEFQEQPSRVCSTCNARGKGGWYETFDRAEIETLGIVVELGHIHQVGPTYEGDGKHLVVTDAETVGGVLDHLGAAPVPADPDLRGEFVAQDVLPEFAGD